jgi:predicted RNA-binding protein YlxR (DUF448 family)/ribosomal protein L7Ae-like RNA K-turn-binding protein
LNVLPTESEAETGSSTVRQCAFTRKRAPKAALLRLELDPDGRLGVDLRAQSGGRGIYVLPEAFAEALTPKGMGRMFRGSAKAVNQEDAQALLSDTLRRLYLRLGDLLGLARRAGEFALGADAVSAVIRDEKRRPLVVLAASNISHRSLQKLQEQICQSDQIYLVVGASKEVHGQALGRDEVSIAATWHSVLGQRLLDDVTRIEALKTSEANASLELRKE